MNTTVRMSATQVPKDWHVIDAAGRPLGRVATEAATLLRGKHKPTFEPHLDQGDFVIVINAKQVHLTRNKAEQKVYYRHSGYPGGIKSRTFKEQIEKDPRKVIETAVRGMLPKNRLGRQIIRHLKVYGGPDHPHEAQIVGSERSRTERTAPEIARVRRSLMPGRRLPQQRAAEEEPETVTPAPEVEAEAPPTQAEAATPAPAEAEATAPPEAEATAPQEPEAQAEAPATEEAPAEEKPKPRRRTRRKADEPAAEAEAVTAEASAEDTAAEGDEQPKPKRRTRARKKTEPAAETPADDTADPAAADAPAEDAEEN